LEVGRLILQSPGVMARRSTCRIRKKGRFTPWSRTMKDFIASFCSVFHFSLVTARQNISMLKQSSNSGVSGSALSLWLRLSGRTASPGLHWPGYPGSHQGWQVCYRDNTATKHDAQRAETGACG